MMDTLNHFIVITSNIWFLSLFFPSQNHLKISLLVMACWEGQANLLILFRFVFIPFLCVFYSFFFFCFSMKWNKLKIFSFSLFLISFAWLKTWHLIWEMRLAHKWPVDEVVHLFTFCSLPFPLSYILWWWWWSLFWMLWIKDLKDSGSVVSQMSRRLGFFHMLMLVYKQTRENAYIICIYTY